jgi:hypothetical protein
VTRRGLQRAAAGLALALGTAAGVASPSFADSGQDVSPLSSDQCATGGFCVWSATLCTGTIYGVSSTSAVSVGGHAGSVWNIRLLSSTSC